MTMMIAFGSAFGNTVMTRMNLFIGVYKNLLRDWTSFLGFTVLILVVATLEGQRAKKAEQKELKAEKKTFKDTYTKHFADIIEEEPLLAVAMITNIDAIRKQYLPKS